MKKELENHLNAWIEKAEHDLLSADRLIEIEPSILDNACFHCQQAVEKYLKTFLIWNGVEPEHTHHLGRLLDACAEYDPIFKTIDTNYVLKIRLMAVLQTGSFHSIFFAALIEWNDYQHFTS